MGKINMAITMRETLNSHPTSTLKKEISKTNIKGYSKMKKAEIIELMMKNKDRFLHIMFNEKKEKEPTKKDDSNLNFLNALSKETRKERLKLKKYSKYKLDTKGKAVLNTEKSRFPKTRGGFKVDQDLGITEPEAEQITGMKSKKKPSKAPAKKEPEKKKPSKAPAKKEPEKKKEEKKEPAKKPAKDKKVVAQIKKEYQNALNKYYGEIFKFRKNDNYSDYTMLIDSLEHNIDGDIFQIREKFQLIYQNDFRDSGANDFNLNLDELDYKKLSNYKKLIKYDTAFDYIGKPEKKKEEKKTTSKKSTSKKAHFQEYQDELDKAIKIFRDKVENHKNILDIDYQTSIKFRKFNAYKNLLNTSVTGTIPERIEKYKKRLVYVDEVVKKNKIKVEKKKEEKKATCESTSKKKHQ